MNNTNTRRLPTTNPARATNPLVVSLGMGVDSVAMLIEMHRRGVKVDAVLFADTGAERTWTYAALPVVASWLKSRMGLDLTIVRTTKGGTVGAPYLTLYGNCTANETAPDILFSPGKHGCSVEWKGKPLDAWTLRTYAAHIAAGGKVTRAIGYDASPADTRRSASACAKAFKRADAGKVSTADAAFDFWYPLQDWNLTRDALIQITRDELGAELLDATGFDRIRKSACVMCPSTTKVELEEMARDTWTDCLQALVLELRAIEGKHGLDKFDGLGRSFRWSTYLDSVGLLPADWRTQAVELGYLPADWSEHVATMDAERDAFQAPYLVRQAEAVAELDAATAALPAEVVADLARASKAGRKKMMAVLVALPYVATARLAAAVAAVEAGELATRKDWQAFKYGWKRIARASDWLNGTAFEPAGLRAGGFELLAAAVERVA